MPEPTDNHGLLTYEQGEESWDHSEDMEHIEQRIPLHAPESTRSDYTPHNNAIFISTDTKAVYEGNGLTWDRASRDYEEIGADRLSRSLDADGNDITNIDELEVDTLVADLDFDGDDITGVDILDVNRLGSNLSADGHRITNVSELSIDRLGDHVNADDYSINNIGGLGADRLLSNLDADGNSITGIDDLGVDRLVSDINANQNDIVNVDEIEVNRLMGDLSASGHDITSVGTFEADQLGDDLNANSNSLYEVHEIDSTHIENTNYNETVNDMGNVWGSTTIDLHDGNVVTATLVDDTSFSISNASSVPKGNSLTIYLEGDYSVDWPYNADWPGGEPPDDPGSGNLEVVFVSTDGGDSWRGRESGRNFR